MRSRPPGKRSCFWSAATGCRGRRRTGTQLRVGRRALPQLRQLDRRDTGKQFSPKQNYYVGGNTKFYGAILFRFRERDFEASSMSTASHPSGPCPMPTWNPGTPAPSSSTTCTASGAPTRSSRRPPNPTRIRRSAMSRGSPSSRPTHPGRVASVPAAHRHPIRRVRAAVLPVLRCATCDGFPCLVNGKADAHIVCVEPALRYPNVTLLTGTLVIRLDTDPSGRSVNRVVIERDGAVETYSADVVVVAGGAINSAALLLRSASDRHRHGLGNSSGVVGRHLMLHNNSSLIAFSTMPNPTKFQKTLGINDFYFRDPMRQRLSLPAGRHADARQERRRAGRLRRAGCRRPGRPGPPLDRLLAHHRRSAATRTTG